MYVCTTMRTCDDIYFVLHVCETNALRKTLYTHTDTSIKQVYTHTHTPRKCEPIFRKFDRFSHSTQEMTVHGNSIKNRFVQ